MGLKHIQYLCLLAFMLLGCDKYLDVKPDRSLLVPNELNHFRALLDNEFQTMNQSVALGFMGADNYYLAEAAWVSLNTRGEKNAYIWAEDIFAGEPSFDWNDSYLQVFIANTVLDGLEETANTAANKKEWAAVKGTALFFRAYAFYGLLQLFAPPYSPSAGEAPGIPLPLTVDINVLPPRKGLLECYEEVLGSLKKAADLLPASSGYKTRPDKAAAYGLLARICLSMQDYENAKMYSGKCLQLQNELLVYSNLDTQAPFEVFNKEVIFHSILNPAGILRTGYVVPELYASYDKEDLRKQLFFDKEEAVRFTGNYTGRSLLFGGLATDEVYLIRAECRARLGDIEGAMEDLNTLLETRWTAGAFEPFTAASAEEALVIILEERRKELLFRGLRWTDLRRLNQDPRFAKTLTRTLNGETYTLPPNDPKYIYPIPDQEIDMSGIEQNFR